MAAKVSEAFEAQMAAQLTTAPKAEAGRDHDRGLQGANGGLLTDGSVVSWVWIAVAGGVVVGLPFSEYPAGGLVQYILLGLAVIALPPVVFSLYGRLRLRLKNHPE